VGCSTKAGINYYALIDIINCATLPCEAAVPHGHVNVLARSKMKRIGIFELSTLAISEQKARRFLVGFCWKNHQRYCPDCKNRKLYRLGDGRRRCGRCGYTFHDFSRRFLNRCAFTSRQWLWFLKLFALDVPPAIMAEEMGICYATILKAVDTVRRAILAQALDAPQLYESGIWPGPGNPPPVTNIVDSPVFGLIEVGGLAICDLLPDLSVESILHFKLNFYLKTASVGQVVYTAPYKQYQALISCGPGLWPARYVRHDDKRLPAEGSPFWVFTKQRLRQLRGIPASHFPLYLKECELRYNARDKDLIPVLAQILCTLVPRRTPPARGNS
jgi:transposase